MPNRANIAAPIARYTKSIGWLRFWEPLLYRRRISTIGAYERNPA